MNARYIWILIAILAIVSGAFLIKGGKPAALPPEDNAPPYGEAEVKGEEDEAITENPGNGGCYVGGCSGQLCTENRDMVSTCEFRPEYVCYRTAKCERQASGQCGWTETPELRMCLARPPQL